MTNTNTELKNNLFDSAYMNLIKANGLTNVLQAAVNDTDGVEHKHINETLMIMADLLNEAVQANKDILAIDRQERTSEKQMLETSTSGM